MSPFKVEIIFYCGSKAVFADNICASILQDRLGISKALTKQLFLDNKEEELWNLLKRCLGPFDVRDYAKVITCGLTDCKVTITLAEWKTIRDKTKVPIRIKVDTERVQLFLPGFI